MQTVIVAHKSHKRVQLSTQVNNGQTYIINIV